MELKGVKLALVCALTGALAQPVSAASVKESGTACWTGVIEYLSTTKKDMGWNWSLDYTYVSDDNDPAKAASGRCFGTAGMVAGKVNPSPYYCIHNVKDGSRMTKTEGGPGGVKGVYFGGTGSLQGTIGGYVGGPSTKLPAEKGRFAGCRHTDGEHTTAK